MAGVLSGHVTLRFNFTVDLFSFFQILSIYSCEPTNICVLYI